MPGSWRERQNRPALSRDSNPQSISQDQGDEIVVRGEVPVDHLLGQGIRQCRDQLRSHPDPFSQALENGHK
jgi:hypothetical protein